MSFFSFLYAKAVSFITVFIASVISLSSTFALQPSVLSPSASSTLAAVQTSQHSEAASTPTDPSLQQPASSTHQTQGSTSSSSSSPARNTATSSPIEIVAFPKGVDNSKVKSAVVNIMCISDDDRISSMTGSGVIIDPRGVILTNAHIGQYFLLTDYMEKGLLRCTIRGGNPARTLYYAELLYLPRQWIVDNAATISETDALGSGENDFALLRITGKTNGSGLPSNFPFLPYSTESRLHIGDTVVLAGYPAEFIPTSDISMNLYDLSVAAKLTDIFTFESGSPDLAAMQGSYVAQRGSSGGPMIDEHGNVVGIIATASSKFYKNSRNLYSITLRYINTSLLKYSGHTLEEFLSDSIAATALKFNREELPTLRQATEAAISASN